MIGNSANVCRIRCLHATFTTSLIDLDKEMTFNPSDSLIRYVSMVSTQDLENNFR